MADNNQQVGSQPSAKPVVSEQAGPQVGLSAAPVQDLGLNEAKVMRGPSVSSPLSGANVSMTVGQPYGGPIISTEVEPGVRNETNPYGDVSV